MRNIFRPASKELTSSCPKLYFKCPTTHSGPICHCRKACREILRQNRNGVPARKLLQNTISLKALRISAISTTAPDRKWPTTLNAAPFLIRSDSRLSRRLVFSHQGPFFTSSAKWRFRHRVGQETRLVSLRGARDLRISGLNDVFQSPDGPHTRWLTHTLQRRSMCCRSELTTDKRARRA